MKKFKMIALSLIALLAINGSVVFASDIDRPFYDFDLPANHGNYYAPTSRNKVNNTNYSYVKPTSMTYTSRVSFWVADSSYAQIAGDIELPIVSSFYAMYYYSKPGVNKLLKLAVENAEYSSSTAYVSGLVDYD